MSENDVLYCVDQALRAIYNALPSQAPKKSLNDIMLPHLQLLNNEHLCMTPETLLQLMQEMNV
jgi:hypothetical protein